jgi:aryl-alcohol dehydrogenase-like predicted oxidoreductase
VDPQLNTDTRYSFSVVIADPISTMSDEFETVTLGSLTVPRLWIGLWQLSSSAWGTAPVPRILKDMKEHFQQGYTTFDMADHYGSAELLFGKFRNQLQEPETPEREWSNASDESEKPKIIGATKWCVFRPFEVTEESVAAAVEERKTRMGTTGIDILQVHWYNYNEKGYLDAFRILHERADKFNISALALCNFDSSHTDEICTTLGPGVIVSNQVQFSLIDTRPLETMVSVCEKHNVKLITYGTLCGGFLSEKWLGSQLPDAYGRDITPSQRKYLDVILSAWGDWNLFQELLQVLKNIAERRNVSIANVATRWVLDQPCVGAVIIGARLGVSKHIDDNKAVFRLRLTDEDRADIQSILQRSKSRQELMSRLGDCGGEYRS